MTYTETLRYLYGLQKFGMKLGLRNIKSLLRSVGNPENKFASVHIAGTNGKGSTAAMIASILQAAGYKVGLYTSPHVISFTERIKINGKEIDERRVAKYVRLLTPTIDELKATFFEATTAVAFLYFADEGVDVGVIETGLGGRLDATNVLHPLLTIITNIGLDHTEHLGTTSHQIAREKAGIIKNAVPCLIGPMTNRAREVIEGIAASRNAPLLVAAELARYHLEHQSFSGITITLSAHNALYSHLRVRLPGGLQAENARLAVLAANCLREASSEFSTVTADDIRSGVRDVLKNVALRGRLETVHRWPRIVIDVAHNCDATEQLVEAIGNLLAKKVLIVFGVMKDKDHVGMLRLLSKIAREAIVVSPEVARALPSKKLFTEAVRVGLKASEGGTVKDGILMAREKASKFDTILITGSHYVAGEALQALRKLH
jgi:dihydrofolate synthase/folylpolyglutamate synthase